MTTSMLTCEDCHGHGFTGQGKARRECTRCNPVLYVLVPGTVRSRNDDHRHFVPWEQLARLYALWGREFAVQSTSGIMRLVVPGHKGRAWTSYPLGEDRRRQVRLGPRQDGKYQLPEE